MSLHDKVMNIPCKYTTEVAWDSSDIDKAKNSYKEGHRDARHEAAEMAIKIDLIILQLTEALAHAQSWHRGDKWRNDYENEHHDAWQQQEDRITEALRSVK